MNISSYVSLPGLVFHEFCHYVAGIMIGWHVTKAQFIGETGFVYFREGINPPALGALFVFRAPMWFGAIASAAMLRELVQAGPVFDLAALALFWLYANITYTCFQSDEDRKGTAKALKTSDGFLLAVEAAYFALVYLLVFQEL